jgi:hypothetical protein
MRAATVVSFLMALCFAAGAAQARPQSEDEAILKGSSSEPARAQSKKDDEIDDEELDEQVFYSGFGVGRVGTDFVNLGEAINLEAVMGFRVPTLPWFSLELDISQTIIPGENKPVSSTTPISNCSGLNQGLGLCTPGGNDPATFDRDEFGASALGISAAFKSGGRFYVAGKYGYRYIATSIQELDDDRSGNGLAFGVGYRWGKGQSGVELGYKQLADDVESVGLTFFVRSPRR